VAYVKDIRLGDRVEVRVESSGGKSFTGVISRFSHKVDETTRTMVTEIEMPNPNLELVPGMYATVVLKVERRPQVLTIPAEAVAADKKTVVYVVNPNHEIEERPVTLGLETPDRYEVSAGLNDGDMVVVGGRANVRAGQKVDIKMIASRGGA
jgi:RND family efflux transporter MFP subunit